ncbi:gag-pol polyprotein [Striga asiatica]|uniref:Gag-pol polyprotein n=1 Tax=Striga asiatica TaxID=4170 RepID=A0A5A7REH5_STRAF|nr:gag-pol polyprotein [Striga asiatica]
MYGQQLRRQQKSVKCKKCGVVGHNSKTCDRRTYNEEAGMRSNNVQPPPTSTVGLVSRDGVGGSVHMTKKQKQHPTLLPPVFEEAEEIEVFILTQMSQSTTTTNTNIEGPSMWDQLKKGRTRDPPVDDSNQKKCSNV